MSTEDYEFAQRSVTYLRRNGIPAVQIVATLRTELGVSSAVAQDLVTA